MNQRRYPVPQTNPPLSPRKTLPTMYDLPSEDPKEPGLPDEFHDLQPQLLSATLRLRNYAKDEIFTGTDLNLYYDVRHPLWHKRPDWFLVLGVPRLYDGVDLRSSYVLWQEGVNPFVVVELLSPGTEKEDLGEYGESSEREIVSDATEAQNGQAQEKIPGKWQVYEQILRVPYYIVFSRYTNQVRFFRLVGGHYDEQNLDASNPRIWIPELKLGLSLWQGEFDGITRLWLRWYDEQGWVPTDAELTEQERALKELAEQERALAKQERAQAIQQAEQANSQLRQVLLNMVEQGFTIAQIAALTGLSEAEIERFI